MTGPRRSTHRSFRAREAHGACSAGIILGPGRWAVCASFVQPQLNQVWYEEEKPAAAGGEGGDTRGSPLCVMGPASLLGPDQTHPDREAHQTGQVVHADALHELGAVRLHRPVAEAEAVGDVFARVSLGGQL